jgi:hypothetical protein
MIVDKESRVDKGGQAETRPRNVEESKLDLLRGVNITYVMYLKLLFSISQARDVSSLHIMISELARGEHCAFMQPWPETL